MLEDDSMLEVAQALLRAKADIQRVGVVFLEEFNLVFSGSPLHWAIMARSLPAAESLLACGADAITESPMPTAECNSYSGFPIDVAACMFMPELVELLLRFGAALDAREDETRTVLHFIGDTVDPFRLWLYHGTLLSEAVAETIDLLLRSGADLNFESEDEPTPLSWIATRSTCTVSVLEQLLSFGPDCSEDTIRITAESLQHDHINARKMVVVLDFCSSHLSREEYVNGCIQALHCLVRDGTVAAAREVLSRFEVTDLRVIDDLELLHQAARNDQAEMLELLMEFGATLDLDKTGTAASVAASLSKQKALDYLLRRGASLLRHPSRDVSATLLHDIVSSDASLYESEELLEYIYAIEEHRSRLSSLVNNFDGKGFTALHEAIVWGSLTNIARLLEMGADDRCVRDTDISPTALALLAKTHTPWVIKQQGKPGIVQHKKNMDEIITYLTDSIQFSQPQAVEHCERIVNYLTQPSPCFEQSNQAEDWYMRKSFSPGIEKATTLVESWLRRREHEE
jgi:ankyrin repeat protein